MRSRCAVAQPLCCMAQLTCNQACNFHSEWHMQLAELLAVQGALGVAHSQLEHGQRELGEDRTGLREARTGLWDG